MTRRRRDERGASAVELVLYMPLLMIAIILTVQFALIYLANQSVSAAAREAGRIARVTGDPALGDQKGLSYARSLGDGVLRNPQVSTELVGDTEIRVQVSGRAPQLLPFLISPEVSEEVQGPIERFDPDGP